MRWTLSPPADAPGPWHVAIGAAQHLLADVDVSDRPMCNTAIPQHTDCLKHVLARVCKVILACFSHRPASFAQNLIGSASASRIRCSRQITPRATATSPQPPKMNTPPINRLFYRVQRPADHWVTCVMCGARLKRRRLSTTVKLPKCMRFGEAQGFALSGVSQSAA